ncbi:MAG: DUF928 domain-containing protein [Synechococcales cyanobacterium CRU_2_2]|nr:DUF928 domain-containing protein [Synechococcales cyanobacterium CRU_2_2]
MNQQLNPQPQHEPQPQHTFRRSIARVAQASFSLIAVVGGMAIADSSLTRQPLTADSLLGQPAAAQTQNQVQNQAPDPSPAQPRVRWTPKQERGNAKGTLSGGRRGQESAACDPAATSTRLTLLVPPGRESLVTTDPQPTLSWQIATQQPTTLRFILSDINQPTPLHTQSLSATATGIQSVKLPNSVSLADGQTYRWTVVVNCPDGQKSEIYARSFIRKTSGESFTQQLSQKSAVGRAAVFAENGIWYDALGQLLQAQEKVSRHDSQSPAAALSALLEQALPDSAPAQLQP